MKRLILAICLVAAVAFVPTCRAQSCPTPVTYNGSDGNNLSIVKVNGNGVLMNNGAQWVPHGVVSVALVQTVVAQQQAPPTDVFALAYNAYSELELDQMKTDGVDTIRFQISQPGLNPNDASGNYDPCFLTEVNNYVNMALNKGFVVILCIQSENQGGTYQRPALPNAVTISDWNTLASESNLQNNPNVMFEIFNEPSLQPTAANWRSWRTAHNNVISAIRAAGANNIVIADGLSYGKTLNGALNLTDPLTSATPPQIAQIAYSTHPYFTSTTAETQAGWEANFGNFAATHVVINTEWGAQDLCDANTANAALGLLKYMNSLHVGLMAYAMDNPNIRESGVPTQDGKMFTTMNPWELSTLVGVNCGATDTTYTWGPGNIISAWYVTGTPPTSLK